MAHLGFLLRGVVMKVRMKLKISGTRNDQQWPEVGEEIDLPADEAKRYIEHGYCEAVAEAQKEAPKK